MTSGGNNDKDFPHYCYIYTLTIGYCTFCVMKHTISGRVYVGGYTAV